MDHDQNFKNLVLDYPREALAFCAEAEARAITPDVRITPVREEQLKERLGERFREQQYPDEVEIMKTFSERVRDEGMQQGIQQGEAVSLLRLMHHKFGEVPEKIRHRVESAEPETLTRWFDQALRADNLDEVLH
jgi:hypothetical protein